MRNEKLQVWAGLVLAIALFFWLPACDEGDDNDGPDPVRKCLDLDGDGYFCRADCGTPVDCDDNDPAIDDECPPPVGMVRVPAGCFEMGDAFSEGDADELPVHDVCLTADFFMDTREVSNAAYRACVDAGGCSAPAFVNSYTRPSYYGNPAYDDFPVIFVDWDQASTYCAWMGGRLPTEAEWEYAARGGLAGKRYPGGDAITGADANYFSSGDPWENDTSPVGHYSANGYGLYDMAGNVWEWTSDRYGVAWYASSPTDDPTGPATGGSRVVRGGGFSVVPFNLRVAERLYYFPATCGSVLGFRCVGD